MTECQFNLSILRSQNRGSLLRALDAFRQYLESTRDTYLKPRRARLQNLLAAKPQPLLEPLAYDQILTSVDHAISCNSRIATAIYRQGCSEMARVLEEINSPESWYGTATELDCSIARACVRGLFRDWSREGATERDLAHGAILNILCNEFCVSQNTDRAIHRVLVPGAGLARLSYSIRELGFSVEGNDVSYHALLTCMYLFAAKPDETERSQALYPWALSFSNHLNRAHQLQKTMVPDIWPSHPICFTDSSLTSKNQKSRLVLTDGSFVDRYGTPGQANMFSALVTCYFIDTAPNLLEYVDTAWNCLQLGGVWINIGPLLWNIEENGPAGNREGDLDGQDSWRMREEHLSSSSDNSVLELTADEILLILRQRGFTIEEASGNVGSSPYVGNQLSMLQYTYNMAFWVARKGAAAAQWP